MIIQWLLEKKSVRISELSEHSQKLRNDLGMKCKPTEKLIPNLNKKEKYVVHYRNLQLYVSHGLKVVKVHRVIMFQQLPQSAKYIELNTEKRKKANNPFEKDFFSNWWTMQFSEKPWKMFENELRLS